MIPNKYLNTGEGAIASYDFNDIAEGTGVVMFYGFTSQDNSAVAYHLGTAPVYGATIATQRSTMGTTTMNFDLTPFNMPRVIKGTAIFSCGVGGENNIIIHITAKVQKWDGTTATDCSSTITTGSFTSVTPPSSTAATMLLVKIPLTETHFKKGEILRLVVGLVTENGGEGEIGHDPMDRPSEWINADDDPENRTEMRFFCPFKIDL